MKQSEQDRRSLCRAAFFIYGLVMIWLLFGRPLHQISGLSYGENVRLNTQLVPFYTIRNFLHIVMHGTNATQVRYCFINLVGNVIFFIPAGILLPALWKKQRNLMRFFATSLSIILSVEILQLVTLLGVLDVDDLILNLCGMILGFLIRWLTCMIRH